MNNPAKHRQPPVEVQPAAPLLPTADPAALDPAAPDPAAPPPFDVAAFDPGEFEWRPVPRRPRADGWTPDVQRAFIEALADTGMVEAAARAVNMSVQSAYRLRRAPGAESFARAWKAAVEQAANRLVDIAFQRAIEGVDVPIFDRDGCRIGAKRQYSDRLMMFLLRAYHPDRFRLAHRADRGPAERLPDKAPAESPVAPALAALTPPVPPEPHRLMEPDRLAAMVDGARGMEALYALYPDLDRERYAAPRIPPDHSAATARRLARQRGFDPGDRDEGHALA